MARGVAKRALDILGASLALLVLSPVMATTALLVRMKLGSPILFRQLRPGLNEIPFEILKFRTMTDECDADGVLLPNESRLTPFGRALRRTSLDELPELVNVLRGEMSLVGPRPLRMEYLSLYDRRQRRRHEVRPGLTGLAQVEGRNRLSWEERFLLDVRYVEEQRLSLDFWIILRTALQVVRGSGVVTLSGTLVEPFRGSKTNSTDSDEFT
jgi:sugar transferase EpsL